MRFVYSLILALGVAAAGYSQTGTRATTGMVNSSDSTFLENAGAANLAEIQLGRLAEKNASSEVVKQFGQRMVTDHTKLLDETRNLAARKDITLPASPGTKDEAVDKSLSAKTGSAFDKAYIQQMIRDHTHDISAFEQEANSGRDADIRALASQTLPTLQEHLRLAQSAAKQLGLPATTGGAVQ